MMAKLLLGAVALGAALTLPIQLSAAERRVPADYPTIQQALAAAEPGDTVRVAPGDYRESLQFNGKNVNLISEAGADRTRLLAYYGAAVQIGPGGSLIGFTITPAPGSYGSGVVVIGSGTLVRSNIFEGLTQTDSFAGAVAGNSASPVIDGNVFRNQNFSSGYLSGTIVFINYSSPVIVNNLFVGNQGRALNLTLPEGSQPQIINNTFWSNQVAIRYDRRVNCRSQVFRNNLLVGNGTGLEVEFGTEAENAVWENNLVYGNTNNYSVIADPTGLNGNLSVDPRLVDPPHGDFHLRKASPAVDAGSGTGAPDHDLEGDPRPVDGNGDGVARHDIGADEFVPRPPRAPGGLVVRSGDGQMTLTWTAIVDVTAYRVQRSLVSGGPYSLVASVTEAQSIDTGVVNGTKYFYVVSAINEFGEGANSTEGSEVAGNLRPIPADDLATTPEDTPVTINVLANDQEPNQDALSVSGLTHPANATVTNVNQRVLFTPAANFNGTNTFTYHVSDGRGGEATALVTVVVTAVNDPPVPEEGSAVTVPADSTQPFRLSGSDVDGDPLTFQIDTPPNRGQVRDFNPETGAGVYVPAHGFSGLDELLFRVSDGRSSSAVAPFRFVVSALADVDGNGLPDAWEAEHDVGNPQADRDSDGMTNFQEYRANTDPDASASALRLVSVARNAQGHCRLIWQSVGGTRYRVLYSDARPGGGYSKPAIPIVRAAEEEMDPASIGVSSTMGFTDDLTLTGGPPSSGGRYYQVIVVR